MLLKSVQAKVFRSITDSGTVQLDPKITVLVGQNESGKTAFLQALHKANAAGGDASYEIVTDYPRKAYLEYERRHESNPDCVLRMGFELLDSEVDEINRSLGVAVMRERSFTINAIYNNTRTIEFSIDEATYVEFLLKSSDLPSEQLEKYEGIVTVWGLIEALKGTDLNAAGVAFRDRLEKGFPRPAGGWKSLDYHIWKNFLERWLPKFLYFDDYYLLPGKINLAQFQERVAASAHDKKAMHEEDRTMLSLLQMAGIEIGELVAPTGYEKSKVKLESISISITDKIFEYWKQNPDLEVEFDIRPDPLDQAPFNNGNNLYIRIKNRRHRVTVPFSQRSRGFIWFFSFIVWFESIKKQIGEGIDLILLLDEPGLSLHALAQADLLRYIDDLSHSHQILYSTHSPFMVHGDRLHQVRTVEDFPKEGTRVSDNLSGSDPRTIFPLQAALGYTIAQNLFIARRNLLVEGPGDLIYLRFFSTVLDAIDRTCLRDDVILVPAGGLDKIATFVALLKGNELELGVLHDYDKKPDQRIESIVREKLIRDRQVLNYAQFRNPATSPKKPPKGSNLPSTDVEDLMTPSFYLRLFNKAFEKDLKGYKINESELPADDRIVVRLNQFLFSKGIALRPSGGFNHYLVANHLASHPVDPTQIEAEILARFEAIFSSVNSLYSPPDD